MPLLMDRFTFIEGNFLICPAQPPGFSVPENSVKSAVSTPRREVLRLIGRIHSNWSVNGQAAFPTKERTAIAWGSGTGF